jgi:hypothetical protein
MQQSRGHVRPGHAILAGHISYLTNRTRKDPIMTRIIALALALMLGGVAHASDKPLDTAKAEEIKAALTEQGYDVRRIKTEDGLYEAYAVKDGVKYELYLNEKLEIVRTKQGD